MGTTSGNGATSRSHRDDQEEEEEEEEEERRRKERMRQEDRRKKHCRSEEPHISHASRHCSAMELPPKPLVRNAPMSDVLPRPKEVRAAR